MTEPAEPTVPAATADPADPIAASTTADEPTEAAEAATAVVVYWRPGCGFCSSLFHGLRKAGVPTVEVDIWSEPDGAEFVRQHARGNETVPTVDIAGTVLVNPSADRVVAEAVAAGIALGEPAPRWWRRGAAATDDA